MKQCEPHLISHVVSKLSEVGMGFSRNARLRGSICYEQKEANGGWPIAFIVHLEEANPHHSSV